MKIKTVIIGAVVFPIGLYVLAKTGMEYKAKKIMDDLIHQAAPKNLISYKDIQADVRGQTRINEISIRSNTGKSPITIDQVVISGPGPISYVMNDYIPKTDVPSKIHIYLDSIRVPTNNPMINEIFTSTLKKHQQKKTFKGCSIETFLFDPKIMRELGIKEYAIDAEYKHSFNASTNAFFEQIDVHIQDIGAISFSLDLDSIQSEAMIKRDFKLLLQNPPALTSFDIAYSIKKKYADKYKAYCASLHQITEAQLTQLLYLDQKLALAKAGIQLGNGLKRTFKNYLSEWGEIRMTIRPDKPFPFTQMMSGINDSTLEKLNIEFSVNDNLLTNMNFTYKPITTAKLQAFKDAKAAIISGEKNNEIVRYETKFVQISVAEIKQYKGHLIRLLSHQKITNKLKTLQGTYVNTIEPYIRLKVRVGGSGRMIIPTSKNRITKIEVLKKVRVVYDKAGLVIDETKTTAVKETAEKKQN